MQLWQYIFYQYDINFEVFIHLTNFVFSFLLKLRHFHCQHLARSDYQYLCENKCNQNRFDFSINLNHSSLNSEKIACFWWLEFQKFNLKHSYSLLSWLTKLFSAGQYYVLLRLPFFVVLSYALCDHGNTKLRLDSHLNSLFYRVKHLFSVANALPKYSKTAKVIQISTYTLEMSTRKRSWQLWTKYLRQSLVFMWDSALHENFNFYFSAVFG